MVFKIIRNDISNMIADAIVLPANSALLEGPGTSAALFEKAGRRDLMRACKELRDDYRKAHREIKVGTAVATSAYKLNANHLIHAIVPRWIDGNHDEYSLLRAAYLSSLALADALKMQVDSISAPCIRQ